MQAPKATEALESWVVGNAHAPGENASPFRRRIYGAQASEAFYYVRLLTPGFMGREEAANGLLMSANKFFAYYASS